MEHKDDVCKCGHPRMYHYVWKLECWAKASDAQPGHSRCFCRKFTAPN